MDEEDTTISHLMFIAMPLFQVSIVIKLLFEGPLESLNNMTLLFFFFSNHFTMS